MPKLTLNSISPKVTYLEMPNKCKVELISKFMCNYNNKINNDCIILGNEERGIDLSAPKLQLFYMFSSYNQTQEKPSMNFNFNEIQNVLNFAAPNDQIESTVNTVYSNSVANLEKRCKSPQKINALNSLLEMKFSKIEALRALNMFDFDVQAATEFLINNDGRCVNVDTVKCRKDEDLSKKEKCRVSQPDKNSIPDLINPEVFSNYYKEDIRFSPPDHLLWEALNNRSLYGMENSKVDLGKIETISEYLKEFAQDDANTPYTYAMDCEHPERMKDLYEKSSSHIAVFLEICYYKNDPNLTFYQLVYHQILLKLKFAISIQNEYEFIRVFDQFDLIDSVISTIAFE